MKCIFLKYFEIFDSQNVTLPDIIDNEHFFIDKLLKNPVRHRQNVSTRYGL